MLTLLNLNLLITDNYCFTFDNRVNWYAKDKTFGIFILRRL